MLSPQTGRGILRLHLSKKRSGIFRRIKMTVECMIEPYSLKMHNQCFFKVRYILYIWVTNKRKTQYKVFQEGDGPPQAIRTASVNLGIDGRTASVHSSLQYSRDEHHSSSYSHNWCFDYGGGACCLTCCSKTFHRCSLGLRFGDCESHTI